MSFLTQSHQTVNNHKYLSSPLVSHIRVRETGRSHKHYTWHKNATAVCATQLQG